TAVGLVLAVWLRRAAETEGMDGRQVETGPVGTDVGRDGAHGHARRDLAQSRDARRRRDAMGEGLCHRLADCGGDRISHPAHRAAADRADRRASRRQTLMLSAIDLAKRIESGRLSPAAVVELCAKAIAEREHDIGAFAALDLDAARRSAERPQLAAMPLY